MTVMLIALFIIRSIQFTFKIQDLEVGQQIVKFLIFPGVSPPTLFIWKISGPLPRWETTVP